MLDIALVEELGAHRLLHGSLLGQPISLHVSKDIAASTGPLRASFKPETLSLFAADTGVRL